MQGGKSGRRGVDPRVWSVAACFLMASAGGLALADSPVRRSRPLALGAPASAVQEAAAAEGRPSPAPLPAPGRWIRRAITRAHAIDEAPPPRAPQPPPDRLAAYRGLGAWIDLYDYGRSDSLDPAAVVDELATRGVRTIYLQTGRWSIRSALANPGAADYYLELAHARGIRVVGWYLPGFANPDLDLLASWAVIQHESPSGHRFDGFAADIEDPTQVGFRIDRFNGGIVEYARRLREGAPGEILGAIVVDAKNNERAPGAWAGFPWQDIARNFDVVLPMAYWSVTKPRGCPAYDAAAYMRTVGELTVAHMGTAKPLHMIGGIADCVQVGEMAGYVDAALEAGAIGGSIYDFSTTHASPDRDAIWEQLARFNG